MSDYYKEGKIEVIDCIEALTYGLDSYEGFTLGNVIKYIGRFKKKPCGNKVDDLIKAREYIDMCIKYEEDGGNNWFVKVATI